MPFVSAALPDATEREFEIKGGAHTTLNNVACAAGLTRGAIYCHFKDNSALVQAMYDRVFLPMQTLLNQISAASAHASLAALRKMLMHMLEQVSRNSRQRAVFDIMFHHCEKNPEMDFFNYEKQKRGERLAKIVVLVAQAGGQGQLPAQTDTVLVVQAVNSYLIGLIYEWLIGPGAYDLGAHAGPMIGMFLAGIAARRPLRVPPRP